MWGISGVGAAGVLKAGAVRGSDGASGGAIYGAFLNQGRIALRGEGVA